MLMITYWDNAVYILRHIIMRSLGILLLYLDDLRLSFSYLLFRDVLFIAPIISKHAWFWSRSILQNDLYLG